jgi:hypothetical protein
MHVETIREILASHESGISRGGLLAWARLRGDPKMTDAQLDAALTELGDQVIDVQGFLYLREFAPASALKEAAAEASSPPTSSWQPAAPTSSWQPVAPAYEDAPPAGDSPAPPDGGWTAPDEGWTAPPSSGSRRTMVVAAAFVGVFLLVSGVAAFLLRDAGSVDDPFAPAGPGDAPAQPTPTSGTVVGAFTIELGDCLILPSEDEFDEVRRLSCTEPHDGEVFFVDDYPGADYPSGDELDSYVDAQCRPAFEAFTGSDFDDQEVLDLGWFAPTEGSWEDGDHEVLCYLTPVDGGMTSQSYRDANP